MLYIRFQTVETDKNIESTTKKRSSEILGVKMEVFS